MSSVEAGTTRGNPPSVGYSPAPTGRRRPSDESGDEPHRRPSVEPTLVRVSVLGGNTQLDVALPAAVPVAGIIGDLVAAIEARTGPRRDPDDSDGDGRYDDDRDGDSHPALRQQRWTLSLVGQEQIPPNRSLAEAGIRDGDLLLLRPTNTGEAPVLFDDVVDAVSRLNESHFPNWSTTAARYLGYAVAVLACVAAAVCAAGTRHDTGALWPAAPTGIAALVLLVAAAVIARHGRDPRTATVVSMASVPLVAVTGMLVVPGAFGSAHLALGFALALVTTAVSYRLTGLGPTPHSAVVTLAVVGTVTCLVQVLLHAPASHVAAVAAAVGLLIVALAPRLTIVLAKLPVPPVPTAGAPIDAHDIEPSPAIEGIGAIGAMALPKADALERRSYLANAYLTGIVAGATALTAVAAFLAAEPFDGFALKPVLYAVLVSVVLCLRGRSHSDLYQASELVIGRSVALLAVCCSLAVDADSWPITGFVAAMVVGVGALVLGVVAPTHDFSPVMRRAAEIFEYLLVAMIVPLLAWVLDLYHMVREI